MSRNDAITLGLIGGALYLLWRWLPESPDYQGAAFDVFGNSSLATPVTWYMKLLGEGMAPATADEIATGKESADRLQKSFENGNWGSL